MKIKTEDNGWSVYEGQVWTAIDEDTYDGADDSHCPVGWGHTERGAIDDLVEQIVEKLEEKIDDLIKANGMLLNGWKRATGTRVIEDEPETSSENDQTEPYAPQSHEDARGDLGGTSPLSSPYPPSEKPVADFLDALYGPEDPELGLQSRLSDEEYPEGEYHPSDYNGPRPNWEERQGQE
jgi:hypothetical protein